MGRHTVAYPCTGSPSRARDALEVGPTRHWINQVVKRCAVSEEVVSIGGVLRWRPSHDHFEFVDGDSPDSTYERQTAEKRQTRHAYHER